MDNWRLNNADWYDPLNEPEADNPEKAAWLNTWLLTALDIAQANGFKLALCSMPTGSPPFASWQVLLPALRRGKQLGAILSLHAYWDFADPEADLFNSLRHQLIYSMLPEDAQLPLIISEASPGNGYNGPGKMDGTDWIPNMLRYERLVCNDPYLLGVCGFQLGGTESNIQDILLKYGNAIVTNDLPEIGGTKMLTGIHLNADGGPLVDADYHVLADCAGTINAVKVLSGTPPADLDRLIETLGPGSIIMRLFVDVRGMQPGELTPAKFVTDMRQALVDYAVAGGVLVEIHNEPNLELEGLGSQWHSPTDFNTWYLNVLSALKLSFPFLKFGFPGLSPNFGVDTNDWIVACMPAIRASDWLGVHCYWQNANQLEDTDHGGFWKRFQFLGKKLMLTEVANVSPGASLGEMWDKGAQYLRYLQILAKAPIVNGVFFFVMRASDPAFADRVWLRRDMTPIGDFQQTNIAHAVIQGATLPPVPSNNPPIYKRIYVVLRDNLPDKENYAAVCGKHNITCGPSFDDACVGKHLTDRTAIIIRPDLWGGEAALQAYVNKYFEYIGTKLSFYSGPVSGFEAWLAGQFVFPLTVEG